MKEYSFKKVIEQYNRCYNTNVKKFRYKDEEELQEIILAIFDLDENSKIEIDYDDEKVIIL